MHSLHFRSLLLMIVASLLGADLLSAAQSTDPEARLQFRQVRYDATLDNDEARFRLELEVQVPAGGELSAPVLEGDLALVPPQLPTGLRVERSGGKYLLVATRRGTHRVQLELVARITRAEPWNTVSFTGPAAVIAELTARAPGEDIDLQLLSGTLLRSQQTNEVTRLTGIPGADGRIALRWSQSGGMAEVHRRAVVTVETTVAAHVAPTVVKHVTTLKYDILQGKLPQLKVLLPASHALTRLAGEQIRDWELSPATNQTQTLTVVFIKPQEKSYQLTLYSEQTLEALPSAATLVAPQPAEAERESGLLTVSTEDTLAEVDTQTGLRQANAPAGAWGAYRFNSRPAQLALRLKRVEPVLRVADRTTVRLEETRLLVLHSLALTVEKAGIYSLDLRPPTGLAVAEVRGDGVEDWRVTDTPEGRRLRVNFAARVLGARQLDIQLEQALKTFPEQLSVEPLRLPGAERETAEIGASPAAGIHLKTGELNGLREIPVSRLARRTDELLAYTADQPDWKLTLKSERLSARVIAEIFNLVTIGDGIVGGSATFRYGLINQGVQEFTVAVPAHWKNVEFTGPNIRRKELRSDGQWVIGLQEKAWGGFTLVVTYDFQFDPKGATLALGGIHGVGLERETGSVAITAAGSLQLTAAKVSDLIRRIDETELAAGDRGLITRAVLLAYQYSDPDYQLELEVRRFEDSPVLSAVADRTQLITVLTEAGEMLTQASFMVKNNDKQFQRFRLPKDAKFWSGHVNGKPVKTEQDGDWLLVPLPRGVNRDQAFAVDLVYAERKPFEAGLFAKPIQLEAPSTDVPNTYAEWELYAPTAYRVSDFAGSMTVARGTDYGLREAWLKFSDFYLDFLRHAGPALFLIGTAVALLVALIGSAVRRGFSGVLSVLAVVCIFGLLAAMLLPALSRAKARAQRISAVNNLKQIGLALHLYANDNRDTLPANFNDMMSELGTDKVLTDPETGRPFVYVGGGLKLSELKPDSVLAFSPNDLGNVRSVLLADGSVQQLTAAKFDELSRRGYVQAASAAEIAQQQQAQAIRGAQLGQEFELRPQPPAQTAGGGGLGGGIPAPGQPAPIAGPVGSGTRSIRIDVPRSGQAFVFTKVLNIRDEPLSVSARLVKLQTFQTAQMLLQLAGFVLGLALCYWQWRRSRPSALLFTFGLGLALWSVGYLLLSRRVLHGALIGLTPLLLLVVIGWVTWRFWPRRAPALPEPEPLGPAFPPATAGLLLLLGIQLCTAAPSPAQPTAPAGSAGVQSAVPAATAAIAVDQTQPPAPPAVSVLSADYAGSITGGVAQVTATLHLRSTQPNQKLVVFGEDVAVQQFSAKPATARLVREGRGVAVVLDRKGDVTVQCKLIAPLSGDVTRRQLAFRIPAALSSSMSLLVDQAEADVEFPTAVSCKRTHPGGGTRVDALLGGTDRVEVHWTPRIKRAAEIAANVICQNTSLVTLAGGALNVRTIFDYQVTQGELRQLQVRVPADHRLLRVEGDGMRTWELKTENGSQLLLVELLKGVAPAYRLTLETERPLEALPAVVRTQVAHAQDVKRETGLIALQTDEELELAIERTAEVSRVDGEEFAKAANMPALTTRGPVNAFRFLKPDYVLEARVSAREPQIEAVVRNQFLVGSDQLGLSAVLDYTIKRVGVFGLTVAVPEGYRVTSLSVSNLLQYVERTRDGRALVDVRFRERVMGTFSLRLELVRNITPLPRSLAVPAVLPLGAEKLVHYLSVAPEAGVAVQTEAFEGLSEIPLTAIPGMTSGGAGSGILAFKSLGSDPAANWSLKVATETVASWVRAEVVNTLTLTETLVSGRALVRYEIQNAPVKELRLRIPAAFRNVDIAGANIRRRDQDGEHWRVEFQSKVRGLQTLTVTWDQPRPTGTNALALTGVGAEEVERESGVIAIAAAPPLQVTARSATGLSAIDIADIPDWAGARDSKLILAYRYLRPGYALEIEATRFSEAVVLQALVEQANLVTVVADDGQTMTSLSLMVRNHGRQHLEVALPPGATLWSAMVAGQAVRPSVKEGKLLVPLEQTQDVPVTVDVTYVGTNQFPRVSGDVEWVSPRLDVPLKSARWELFLPPDYVYDRFAGTMAREQTVPTLASSFSFLDYSQRESASKAEQAKELKANLLSAKSKLSTGNVKDALSDYNRARNNLRVGSQMDSETRQLEEDLKRAQGSNLINAQNQFVLNANTFGAGAQDGVQQQRAANDYDATAAQAQWTKLQQAQELAVAKVQPIRVNLPTRGLRHSFTQVLQTEVGKPMTIRLSASNDKTVNWPKRLAWSLGAFLLAWGLAAAILRRRPQSA